MSNGQGSIDMVPVASSRWVTREFGRLLRQWWFKFVGMFVLAVVSQRAAASPQPAC